MTQEKWIPICRKNAAKLQARLDDEQKKCTRNCTNVADIFRILKEVQKKYKGRTVVVTTTWETCCVAYAKSTKQWPTSTSETTFIKLANGRAYYFETTREKHWNGDTDYDVSNRDGVVLGCMKLNCDKIFTCQPQKCEFFLEKLIA